MSDRFHELSTYLKQAWDNKANAAVVVLGNEAADLDSMVSAILFGRLKSACRRPGTPLAVPVINCPRGDFVLRTEAMYLFSRLGLESESLVFIDDIDLDRPYRAGRLRLTLVDHNILSAGQEQFADAVEAIIDHHADGGRYPRADPRTIQAVGSAATLVAEALLREQPSLLDDTTSTLLLGTILLDTVNLDPAAGRVTAQDQAMVTKLGAVLSLDSDALFSRLQAEKFNVSALGTGDLLRKDYKAWDTPSGRYGMSTVLTSLENWASKDPDLAVGMDAFRQSKELACLIAMTAYSDAGGFRRELAVNVPDPTLGTALKHMLMASDLDLTPINPPGSADSGQVAFFSQGNTAISRKKLQPLLDHFFGNQAT